jgi:hypothetical protein
MPCAAVTIGPARSGARPDDAQEAAASGRQSEVDDALTDSPAETTRR